jgi:hypothetical protein
MVNSLVRLERSDVKDLAAAPPSVPRLVVGVYGAMLILSGSISCPSSLVKKLT